MIDGSVQKVISQSPQKEDSNKKRFLKDKHQLETVLGPGNINWFDELTERCVTAVSRQRSFKQHFLEFDSPLSSPTVSQLIRSHVKVGESPPVHYHSSPAVIGKYLGDVTPQSTPDNDRHWQKPTLGLSPSPVLKDGSFCQRSSLAIASLGFSHDDSTLSWTNSLATPPRLEDPGAETSVEDTQSRHKDPVRALFSPSPKLDSTGDSIEVLESTDDEGIEELFTENVENDFVNQSASDGVLDEDLSVENGEFLKEENIPGESNMVSTEAHASCTETMVLDQKSMDSWRDNFKRKLLVRSDSFGKKCSAENSPHNIECEEKLQLPADLFARPVKTIRIDSQNTKTVDTDCKFGNLSVAEVDGEKPQELTLSSPDVSAQKEDCFSPVFSQHSSVMKSRGPRVMETKQRKDSVTSIVGETLSDFFDPPSGAVNNKKGLEKKRYASQLDGSDLQQDKGLTEQSISTPKNQVLQSILVKNRNSCGSSGKKVRFSDCVLKYSDQDEIHGSYCKKRRKSKKLRRVSDVDININTSVSKDGDSSIELANSDISGECVDGHVKQTKASEKVLTEKVVTDDKMFIDEGDDVFSQISPSALEVMCNAAYVAPGVMCSSTTGTTEKDKTESNVDNKSYNQEELKKDLDNDRCNTDALHKSNRHAMQDVQVKPKRFLYPSKQQIVVASPNEVFKYKEEETSDCKAKGIVMAIPVHRIVTAKLRNSEEKNYGTDNCKNKVDVNSETDKKTVIEVADEHKENHVVEQRLIENESAYYSVKYNTPDATLKSTVSAGFKIASGKDLSLSEDAVEKAKNLFMEEQKAGFSHSEMNVIACGSKSLNTLLPVVSSSLINSPLKIHEENMEFSDGCENFEEAYLAQDFDDIDNGTNLEHTESQKLDDVKEEPIRTLTNGDEVSDGSKDDAYPQTVSPLSERKCISDGEQNDASYFVDEKDCVLDQSYHCGVSEASEINLMNPFGDNQQSCGFITAGGKCLNLHEEKLKQARMLFAAGDSYDIIQSTKSLDASRVPENDNGQKVVIGRHSCETGNIVNYDKDLDCEDLFCIKSSCKFDGFSTASGKSCLLSTVSMIKAEKLLLGSKDDVELNDGEESKVDTSHKELETLHNRKDCVILPELLIGKERSPFENELFYRESGRIQNSACNKIQSLPPFTSKNSFMNLTDNSSKPKGFRPFKAPKRISVSGGNTDKYPASIGKVTEWTKADHPKSNIGINSCLSVNLQNSKITVTDDNDCYNKVKLLDQTSQNVIKSDSNTENSSKIDKGELEIPSTDICEGIFSQMFADDMEPEDSLCPSVPYRDIKENSEIFSNVTDCKTVGKITEDVIDSSVSCKDTAVNRASSGEDFQLCEKQSTKEMQGDIAMLEVSMKHKGFQNPSGKNGDFSNDGVEMDTNWDYSAKKSETDVQIKFGNSKTFENTTKSIDEHISPVLEEELTYVEDGGQHGEKENYRSDHNVSANVLQKAEETIREKNEHYSFDLSVISVDNTKTKTHNDRRKVVKNNFGNDYNNLDRFKDMQDSNVELGFKGSQTEGGSLVNISEMAVEIAKGNISPVEDSPREISQNCVHNLVNTNRNRYMCMTITEADIDRGVREAEKQGKIEVKFGDNVQRSLGFQPASRKQTCVSDKGLSTVENSCADMSGSHSMTGFQMIDGVEVDASAKALIRAKESLSTSDDVEYKTNVGKLSRFHIKGDFGSRSEFARPDSDKINIASNEAAMKVSQDLMLSKDRLELKDNLQMESVGSTENSAGSQTANMAAVQPSDEAKYHAGKKLREINECRDIMSGKDRTFQGFHTGKGTTIQISEVAMEHARKQFEHLDQFERVDFMKDKQWTGLQEFKDSAEDRSLQQVREQIHCSDILQNLTLGDGNQFQGFQTAKGTAVKVSNEALQHARQQLDLSVELHGINCIEKEKFQGFQTAKGEIVKVSDKGLQHEGQQFEHRNQFQNVTFAQEEKFQGFQTAKGKTVKVCNKALQYDGLQVENLAEKEKFQSFQTAKGKTLKVSDKALQHARQKLEQNDEQQSVTFVEKEKFQGFQTAKGTAVKVSDKALRHARQKLEQSGGQESVTFVEEEKFKDFQKAQGIPVRDFDNTLQNPRQKFEHADALKNVTLAQEEKFQGFQTAKGTAVKVSDKALQHAMEQFEHSDAIKNVTFPNRNKFPGFQTASGTAVKISEKALQRARDQLDHTDGLDFNIPEKEVQSEGFNTKRGLAVNVSEEDFTPFSKTHISNDFVIDSLCNETIFQDFQTAKGSAVKVSAKALQYARKHLEHAAEFENCTVGTESIDQGFETDKYVKKDVTEKAALNFFNQKMKYNMEAQTFADLGNINNDFQPEVELPYKRQKLGHHQERGILGLSEKSSSSEKRKPIKSGPEGMTTDRRHPGFRPFIPVRSHSMEEKTSRRQEISQLAGPCKDIKSIFQTPYKKVGQQKQPDDRGSKSSDLTGNMGPVFHCKRKLIEIEMDTKSSFQAPYKTVDVREQSDDRASGLSDQGDTRDPVLHCKLKSNNADGKDIPSHSALETSQCKKSKSDSKMLDRTENEMQLVENDSKLLNNIGNIENLTNTTCILSPAASKQKSNCHVSRSVSSNHENEMGETGLFSQDEEDMFYCNLVEARKKQEDMICVKKKKKIEPVAGRLYLMKTTGVPDRVKLKDVVTKAGQQNERRIIPVISGTAVNYRFDLTDCYGKCLDHVLLGDGALLVPDDGGQAGQQEFSRAFLTMDGVDPKLVCDKWLTNHYRWIVWKLAAYEISCKGLCGRGLTPENVMLQLKYRYDREIDRAERSALKKIYERDDTASKRMVLCVSSVRFMGNELSTVPNTALKMKCEKVCVELTDGWYKIPAVLDGPLTNMFLSGKISIGQKLCITGAELIGSESACTPLEAPEIVQLKININSTRPAPWDSRMGYQKDPRPLCVPLVSLFDEGGTVGVIDVVLVRKYAVMYMEKLPGGGCVFRSCRDEEKVQLQYQTQRQAEMEKLYNQIQEQIEKEQRQESKQHRGCKKFSKSDIEELSTGEEIHDAIGNAAQPDIVQNYLSEKQHSLLYEYQRCIQDEKRQELNMRVQSAFREKEEELPAERNVTPLLKFRVAGCSNKDLDCQKSTILTVWRPVAEISDLKEGKRYKIYNLNTSAARSKYIGHNVQLTATKQTKFLPREIDENLLDHIYEPREVLWVNDIRRKQAPYGEFDFVGFIIRLVPAVTSDSVHSPDVMYLGDCQCNILCVKFWNGFKSFGENLLIEARCICLSNLMDKATYRNKYLPTVEATPEFTSITIKPQTSGHRHALEKLQSVMKEKATFKEDVALALDELLHRNQNNSTPKRFQRQKSYETISSVTSADEELSSIMDNNNLQDCEKELLRVLHDHESKVTNRDKNIVNIGETHAMKSEDCREESVSITPSSQSRRTGAQSRIAKLSAYATPDSLSPLPVSTSRSVSKGFKPPAFRKKLN